MRLESPWALLLLILVPLVVWLGARKRRSGTLRFSSLEVMRQVRSSRRVRWRRLPTALRAGALVLLVVGLARPQLGREEIRDVTEGVAIQMVVDRSGSMGREMDYMGRRLSRLDVVKRVFREFVLGNGEDLEGRPGDLVGMVAFARYADTVCPLTMSHGVLDRFIENIRLVKLKNEDGTAIGDALALAAARLKNADKELQERRTSSENPEGYTIESKVIILLTDGQNNAGKRTPLEAARLAEKWGIKVHTIGIGGGGSFMTLRTPMGEYQVPGRTQVEEESLRRIARETGGVYRTAKTADGLRDIYEEIDRLEKTRIETVRYADYSERFKVPVLAALALLLTEQILASTIFRRIP